MNRGSHLMCKKWYQLITCTEPVGALNRRSFLYPKDPHPITDAGLSLLLLVLIILQVIGQKCVRLASLSCQFDIFLQVFILDPINY